MHEITPENWLEKIKHPKLITLVNQNIHWGKFRVKSDSLFYIRESLKQRNIHEDRFLYVDLMNEYQRILQTLDTQEHFIVPHVLHSFTCTTILNKFYWRLSLFTSRLHLAMDFVCMYSITTYRGMHMQVHDM